MLEFHVKTVLLVITSDPRTSRRPAEAIRIAAGVGVWKKVDITVYLREAAVLILNESTDDLLDEENFPRYLPMMGDFGRPIYVQRGAPLLARQSVFQIEEIDDGQLARIAASRNCVVRF